MLCSDSRTVDNVQKSRSLFNDTLNRSDYMASVYLVKMNNELEGVWKEAVVVYFKALFQHFA
jgi:hypothetical protein